MNPASLLSGAINSVAGAVNPLQAIEAVGDSFSAVFEAITKNSDNATEEPTVVGSVDLRRRELFATVSGGVSLAALGEQAAKDLAAWYDRFSSLAASQGVDLRDELQISIDTQGDVVVRGDSTQADAATQIFAEHPELADSLRRISAQLHLAQAGRKHAQFADAYARDPQAAIAQYWDLFDSTAKDSLSIRVDPYGAHVS